MAPGNYQDFERTRAIHIQPQATIDIATGAVSGQTCVYLSSTAATADDHYRDQFDTRESVYVLRIPSEYVLRHQLVDTDRPCVWEYRRSMLIPHCGVERFDLDTDQTSLTTRTIAI